MKRPLKYYTKILTVLKELHKQHPTFNIGRHLSTALDEYGDLWNVSDKEVLYALEKYKIEHDIDIPHKDDEDIERIIEEGTHLAKLFAESEDEDDED
jgi:hypothetical protein